MSRSNQRTEERFNYENAKLHYESLNSYLKYVIGIAGTCITVMASVAIYISYSDRQSMKDDYEKLKTEFRSQLVDMHSEAKETENKLIGEANIELQSVKQDAKNNLQSVNEKSENELERIKSETNKTALQETEKQISEIFKSDKIQAIIEKNAIGELKDKLPSTIADYTRKLPKILEAAGFFRGGSTQGMTMLKAYFTSSSEFERDYSKNLYEEVMEEYRKTDADLTSIELVKRLKVFNIKINDLHKLSGDNYPTDKNDIENLEALVSTLNDKNFDDELFLINLATKALIFISGKQFEPFDKVGINNWYHNLKR